MAWNIAGVGRRTRDAAVEAARRAGMRVDDWLDEAIADYAGLDQDVRPQHDGADDDRLVAAAGRLERIARRNARATPPPPARGTSDSFNSVIERMEDRLARAEAQAARAFETVAQILERDDATRDSDRRALIDAVRRLESIRTNFTDAALAGERRGDRSPPSAALDPKAPLDLMAAVSQIAMRRHELEEWAGRGETGPASPDSRPAAFAAASPPSNRNPTSSESSSGTGGPPAKTGPDSPAVLSHLLLDDIRALALKLDDMRHERTDPSTSVELSAMRAEIEAMSRSLADLAPRNAVIALEGAIRDLVQRVEMLRQSGHGESMLAPLETVAAEFHAALIAHDPKAAAAKLESEIRAIGGKIDSLAATTIKAETFEPIRRQTEEVRNLLASAALRTPPLERLERQIGELADRIERLGASPSPHFESAEMAALLAEACRQIEHSPSPAALVSIERRLEQIAARLDQELARPEAPATIDPGSFDDLARRFDEVRQSLETLPPATIDTGPIERLLEDFGAKLAAAGRTDADAQALQLIFSQISDKLDQLSDPEVSARRQDSVLHELGARLDMVASPVDLNPIETLLRSLEAKLETRAAAPVDQEVVEQVADGIARRLRGGDVHQVDLEAVAQQIDTISGRIDAMAAHAGRASEPEPVMRELLERLRAAGQPSDPLASESSAAVNASFDAHLAELRSEQASADQRTQSRFADLQGILEMLAARLASIESELTIDDIDEELLPPGRTASLAAPASSASPGANTRSEVGPLRTSQSRPTSAEDPQSQATDDGEDILIEPGAGAQRARDARDLAQVIGPKTNPAVSVHIAAARRAAQAAMAENSAALNSGVVQTLASSERVQLAARGVQSARTFYVNHKRTVLLGVAIAIATTLAVRVVGVRAPFLQRSDVGGQAFNTAKLDAPKRKPSGAAGAIRPDSETIDVAPTASIAQTPAKPAGLELAPPSGLSTGELMAAIPPGISASLRDATAAGQPNAQYEVAMRLFEGRGLSKDQPAAARWFERAGSLGLAPAQYRLGSMYEKGIGVSRDPAAAKRWYLKAADAGNARAAHNLAVMSAEPGDGPPNYPDAATWFRKAAELGVRDSQYNLAILYARGLGVEKDLGQSWLWFALAAQQGDMDAAAKRDEIARQMDPASLASAVEALLKFKAVKPDPVANEVAAPPGGWDAKTGSPSLGQSPPPADTAHPQAPL
jgi:localization factor PodJL